MMRFFLTLMIIFAFLPGCGSSSDSPTGPRELTGVVTTIESGEGFGAVESFTVKDGEETYLIYVDHDITYDFPLAHLNSHKAGAEPVRVEVERRDNKLYATSISDALEAPQ